MTLRELAQDFPHEICILHCTMISVFSCPTCILASHNAFLLRPLVQAAHAKLAAWCFLRVLCCCVRPLLWWRALKIYRHARLRPTPEVVAHAFIAAQDRPPIVLNNRLAVAYIVWLALTSSHLYHKGAAGRDSAEEMLWGHCKLSLYSFAIQKVFSIVLFVYLINSDAVMRGLHDITLEQHSAVHELKAGDVVEAGNDERRADAPLPPAGRFLKSAECAICFHDFAVGDTVRFLECDHGFHKSCVDPWLTRHQNRCPICNGAVGPVTLDDEARNAPNRRRD